MTFGSDSALVSVDFHSWYFISLHVMSFNFDFMFLRTSWKSCEGCLEVSFSKKDLHNFCNFSTL